MRRVFSSFSQRVVSLESASSSPLRTHASHRALATTSSEFGFRSLLSSASLKREEISRTLLRLGHRSFSASSSSTPEILSSTNALLERGAASRNPIEELSGLRRAKAETASHLCGRTLDPTLNLYQALIRIPGVGNSLAHRACRACGFQPQTRASWLSPKEAQALEAYFNENGHVVGGQYWQKRREHNEELVQLRSVKVLRRMKGWPARGQRTKTNAKTARKFKLRAKKTGPPKISAAERAAQLKKKQKKKKKYK